MEMMASVRWKPAWPAMLRNFRGTADSCPKSVLVKAKDRGVLQSSLCRVGITGQSSEHTDECLRLTGKDA
jgi:hypothetical protein